MNQSSRENDEALRVLLAAARAGDNGAMGEVFQSCREYLLSVAVDEIDTALGGKAGASDLVQETFLEAQRDFGQFQGGSDVEVRAWLRQILLHQIADFARRYRHTEKRLIARERSLQEPPQNPPSSGVPVDHDLVASDSSPSHHAIRGEQEAELARAVERLPENFRQVILLRSREHRTWEEIAAVIGSTPEAVRKLWVRGIERLREDFPMK